MPNNYKRKRCNICGESYEHNYFSKHVLTCEKLLQPYTNAEKVKVHFKPDKDEISASYDSSENEDSSRTTQTSENDSESSYWESDDLDDNLVDSDSEMETSFQQSPSLTDKVKHLICRFLLLWQSVFNVPNYAIEVLLRFILAIISLTTNLSIPFTSYRQIRNSISPQLSFTKYLVCPNCFSIYESQNCTEKIGGTISSKKCCNVQFPHHPHATRRKCNETLMKTIKAHDGTQKFVAFKTYCYRSLKTTLQEFLLRPDFLNECNSWTQRNIDEEYIADIYDGELWKEFIRNGQFKNNSDIGVMLNVDWFQPFKFVNYSIGAIYLVILNLPREKRFLAENVILVGLIPHFRKEPPLNTFLKPLVEELIEGFTNGFQLKTHNQVTVANIKVWLMCVACDLPACRKTCGFLSHSASLGCSKCLKIFPGEIGAKDYSGFDRNTWKKRELKDHLKKIKRIQADGTTLTKKKKLESKYGIRYSVLLELPYMDIIRYHVIDPMHCLFLGISKKMTHEWIKSEKLKKKDCEEMQTTLDNFVVPSSVGRIPHKLWNNLSSFTADQLKMWTIVFSNVLLYSHLPKEDIECWRTFVLACSKLCKKVLSKQDIVCIDNLFLRFCCQCETLYGKHFITPNMHMLCHLCDCIIDYGPIYSFWLFSFERYNGMLGSQKTNKRDVEVQFMKKFLQTVYIKGEEDLLEDLDINFDGIFKDLKKGTHQRGTLSSVPINLYNVLKLSFRSYPIIGNDWSVDLTSYTIAKTVNYTFSELDLLYLNKVYHFIYNQHAALFIPPSAKRVKYIRNGQNLFGTQKSRSHRSSYILANWSASDDNNGIISNKLQPGKITDILIHKVTIDSEVRTHIMLRVEWYRTFEDKIRFKYGRPTVIFLDHPEDESISSFMPIQRVSCKFACTFSKHHQYDTVIVCPLERSI